MKYYTLIIFSLLSLKLIAHTDPSNEDHWNNTLGIGGSINTGNSDTTNLNAKWTSDLGHGCWNYQMSLSGEFDTANGQSTAANTAGVGSLRYFFKPRLYSFTKGDITYDEFATYDVVAKAAIGLGKVFIDNEKHFLSIEAGPGSTHQRISGTKEFQTLFITNGSILYHYTISPTARFSQTLSSDYSSTNTHIETISAIKTKVTDGLALEISFNLKHDSTIPVNSKNIMKTDTTTKIAVVYEF